MLGRIFFFLLGFGLIIVGLTSIILYLNLLVIGYNFFEYVNFIIRRVEFFLVIIGFIVIGLTLNIPIRGKYELHLWCYLEFTK